MLGRFTVRPDDETAGCYGIWDGAVHGWRARRLKDELSAAETAVELEMQYDAHGPRPADAGRVLPAPQPVHRAAWSDGQIEAWVRDSGTGTWYAKVP